MSVGVAPGTQTSRHGMMHHEQAEPPSDNRLLVQWLARASGAARLASLPTFWSNCLAGWWLGGGGRASELLILLVGITALVLGDSLLRDVFETSEEGSSAASWRWGLGFLIAGVLLLLWRGPLLGGLGLTLVAVTVLHHAALRWVWGCAILSGIARCMLYVLGAAFAVRGVTGGVIWCGLALGAFVAGIGMFALWEKAPRAARSWPSLLLLAPILLALLMNSGRYREPALLASVVLGLWELRALRPTFWSPEPDLGRTRAGLVAGIVLVDWLAVCPLASLDSMSRFAPRELSLTFLGLFLATLCFQWLGVKVPRRGVGRRMSIEAGQDSAAEPVRPGRR